MSDVELRELPKIRGGWRNVPEGLHTKTQLNKMGLKPSGAPVALVWSYHNWVYLYDIKETLEKRDPTEKQLAALQKARELKDIYEYYEIEKELRGNTEKVQEEIKRLKSILGLEEVKGEHEYAQLRYLRYKYDDYLFEKSQRERGLATFGQWYEQDFVILDTETTDLYGEILEIAIIDKKGDVLFESLVKPKGSISQGAYEVHGISEEMLKDSPTWPEVWEKIKEILKDKLILIYNDQFDVQMISNSCYAWGLEPIPLNTDCVMRSYADYWDTKWFKLSEASGNWTSHRALDDCFDTLKVIEDMWSILNLEVKE